MSVDYSLRTDGQYEVYEALPPAPARRPRTHRTRTWVAVAGAGLLAILAGLLGHRVATTPTQTAQTPAAQTAPAQTAPTAPAPAPVTTAQTEQTAPAQTPQTDVPAVDVSTVAWQGTLLPVSATAGPDEFSATRSAGFAPSELGAALAAVHLSARIDAYTGPAVFTPTIGDQVAGDTATLLRATTAAYTALAADAGITNGDPVPAPTGQVTGWHITGFDPAALTEVQLLVDTPDGASSVFTVAVQWVDGDWKLAPPITPAGVAFTVTAPDPSLTYAPFVTAGQDSP